MREGLILYREGKYEEALRTWLSSDVPEDQYPEFSYYLGICYARLRRFDEALLYLEQVVGSELGFAQVYQSRMLLGWIYSETQRLKMASYEFKRLLDDGYESAKVWAALGHVKLLEKQLDESIGCLDSALKLEPKNLNAMNSMGYVLAEKGVRLNVAYTYCSRTVRERPKNPSYLDSLGWVLFRMGRIEDSKKVLRAALRLAPGTQVIEQHLRKVMGHHAK